MSLEANELEDSELVDNLQNSARHDQVEPHKATEGVRCPWGTGSSSAAGNPAAVGTLRPCPDLSSKGLNLGLGPECP